jgi:hypothetical protein
MHRLLSSMVHALIHIILNQETVMADFTKLEADLEALTAKLDAFMAAQVPPVDEQPLVDAADAKVEALIAKIP